MNLGGDNSCWGGLPGFVCGGETHDSDCCGGENQEEGKGDADDEGEGDEAVNRHCYEREEEQVDEGKENCVPDAAENLAGTVKNFVHGVTLSTMGVSPVGLMGLVYGFFSENSS